MTWIIVTLWPIVGAVSYLLCNLIWGLHEMLLTDNPYYRRRIRRRMGVITNHEALVCLLCAIIAPIAVMFLAFTVVITTAMGLISGTILLWRGLWGPGDDVFLRLWKRDDE